MEVEITQLNMKMSNLQLKPFEPFKELCPDLSRLVSSLFMNSTFNDYQWTTLIQGEKPSRFLPIHIIPRKETVIHCPMSWHQILTLYGLKKKMAFIYWLLFMQHTLDDEIK